MKDVRFDVAEIHCGNCTSRIEEMLSKVDGIQSVKARVDEKDVTVQYDESIITTDKIIEEIGDLGFDAIIAQ